MATKKTADHVIPSATFESQENIFSQILADSSDGVYDWVMDNSDIVYSMSYMQTLGYTMDEHQCLDAFFLSQIHQDDREQFIAERNKCIIGEQSRLDTEFRIRGKNGVWIWMRDRGKVITRDENGYATRFMGTVLNITEQKNNELMLSLLYKISMAGEQGESLNSLYKAIYDAMPVESGIGCAIAIQEANGSLNVPCGSDGALVHSDHQCHTCNFRQLLSEVISSKKQMLVSKNDVTATPACHLKWFSLMGTPLMSGDKCLGALLLYSRDQEVFFSASDFHLMEIVARQIALAIERKQQELLLSNMAMRDPLTNLANRYLLHDRIAQTLERIRRSSDYICAVLMLDLDRFKEINDEFGHGVGDDLLKSIASLLQKQVRGIDTVCRLGGDEFVILLENISNPMEAIGVAERILKAVRLPLKLGGSDISAGVSIGIISNLQDYNSVENILRDVDMALYQAKKRGRNCYQIFNESMSKSALESFNREQEFRNALKNNEFILMHQPVYDLATNSLLGFEALARWQHPERGLLSPEDFIPQLEQSGCMWAFGRWVLNAACRKLWLWQTEFVSGDTKNLTTFVNIFSKQTSHPKLILSVKEALDSSGLPPSSLCIEIQEAAICGGALTLQQNITQLKNAGIKTCIDNFGRSLSPFTGMWMLPVDYIKLHRSQKLLGPEHERVLENSMKLLQSLRFKTVLVGVESETQLAFAKSAGFDFVQGNFMGTPLSEGGVKDLLRQLADHKTIN